MASSNGVAILAARPPSPVTLQRLRQAQGQASQRQRLRPPLPVVAEPQQRLLTARQAAWLVLRREEPGAKNKAPLLAQLCAQHADVAEAIDLAQDFARLVRQRQGAQLDAWMARVAKSTLVALQRFAKGLADDDDAVKAGLTLPWSNGPVEGQITRLKRLKRQMFGRASLALLETALCAGSWPSAGAGTTPARTVSGADPASGRITIRIEGGHGGGRLARGQREVPLGRLWWSRS